MGLINPTLPTLGQPNASEDADIVNAFSTIIGEINGNLDVANLNATVLEKLGLTGGGVTRRGKSIIAAEESRTNVAYGLMPTPDRVSGIVLPADGLIVVGYQALWANSVGGAGRAAIFIGGNQLKGPMAGGSPVVQETAAGNGTAGAFVPLATFPGGLTWQGGSAPNTLSDVATGQFIGMGGASSGVCYIFAAAGTYDISVQFKASSGSVSVKERKLWVRTLGF